MAEATMLKVRLTRSPIGSTQRQRQTLRGLGLTRVGKTVIVHDNEPTRGRIRVVQHLIEVIR
ncbi:MAG: 50S ribosomal protein L30 [Candidatus Binatia bacterium]